jgi:hypothetical protein
MTGPPRSDHNLLAGQTGMPMTGRRHTEEKMMAMLEDIQKEIKRVNVRMDNIDHEIKMINALCSAPYPYDF